MDASELARKTNELESHFFKGNPTFILTMRATSYFIDVLNIYSQSAMDYPLIIGFKELTHSFAAFARINEYLSGINTAYINNNLSCTIDWWWRGYNENPNRQIIGIRICDIRELIYG